jgi:hypothetical protein
MMDKPFNDLEIGEQLLFKTVFLCEDALSLEYLQKPQKQAKARAIPGNLIRGGLHLHRQVGIRVIAVPDRKTLCVAAFLLISNRFPSELTRIILHKSKSEEKITQGEARTTSTLK